MASSRSVSGVVRIIQIILAPVLSVITPMIKDALEELMIKLLGKARETENPIDDMFVEFLFRLLSLDIPEEE